MRAVTQNGALCWINPAAVAFINITNRKVFLLGDPEPVLLLEHEVLCLLSLLEKQNETRT